MPAIKLLTVLLFLILANLPKVYAQSTQNISMTVDQAVEEAINNNLSLIAERYNVTIAQAQMITARLRPNPVLSIGGDHLDLLGTNFNSINNAGPAEYSIRTDFTIERDKKREKRIEVAQNVRAVVEMQLLNTIRQLTFDVESACVDLLLAKATLALAQDNSRLFNEIVEISATRVRVGDLAQVELTRARVAALQYKNAVLQAQSKLRLARSRLQLLIGHPSVIPTIDIAGDFRRAIVPQNIEIIQQALQQRPDLQALLHDQARSLADLRLQLANGKADYTIGVEYRRQQGLAGRGNSLGFFFSIPIRIFDRNQGEVERVRREQKQIEAKINSLEVQIKTEAQDTYEQYETAKNLLESIESGTLDQARSVFETMEYSYRHGEANFVELIDAQRALNDTKQAYNEAKAEYARSLYLIDSVAAKGIKP